MAAVDTEEAGRAMTDRIVHIVGKRDDGSVFWVAEEGKLEGGNLGGV